MVVGCLSGRILFRLDQVRKWLWFQQVVVRFDLIMNGTIGA